MKNTLEGINSRLNDAEKQIIRQAEYWKSLLQNIKKKKMNEQQRGQLKRPVGQQQAH